MGLPPKHLLMHLEWDVLLYACYLGGQLLTILRRAGIAMRSQINPLRRRRDYLYRNWDLLLIRTAIELPFFYIWRHNDLHALFSLLGWTVPFKIPDGGIAAFALGFFADSTMDWISVLKKIGPWTVPDWLKENIPHLPANGGAPPAAENPPLFHRKSTMMLLDERRE